MIVQWDIFSIRSKNEALRKPVLRFGLVGGVPNQEGRLPDAMCFQVMRRALVMLERASLRASGRWTSTYGKVM